MKELILLPRAEVDLVDAAVWYETQRDGLGRAFDADFNRVALRMQSAPLQFPELESAVRRALLERFPYGVFFVVEETAVVVFAVLHLHRSPGTWKARRQP